GSRPAPGTVGCDPPAPVLQTRPPTGSNRSGSRASPTPVAPAPSRPPPPRPTSPSPVSGTARYAPSLAPSCHLSTRVLPFPTGARTDRFPRPPARVTASGHNAGPPKGVDEH